MTIITSEPEQLKEEPCTCNGMQQQGKKADWCDLHTHSIFSDGTFTPEQLIDEAQKINLKAIALCDHNTVAGLQRFQEAAKGKNLNAVNGVEFSTDYGQTELHVLALFVKRKYFESITDLIRSVEPLKEQSNIRLIEALKNAGYKLDYQEIKSKTPDGKVNRAHIAAALTERGYTSSIKEAFTTLLNKEIGLYVPPKRLDVFEVISFIKQMGAVAVLAHPFLNLKESELCELLPRARDAGLDAMETVYPNYNEKTTKKAKLLASQFNLKESGGSDFHGANKPLISLGIGKGELFVPYEFYLQLKIND